jgi:molybdopterin-guanine dinucleotide biosynthesis protein A
MCLVVMASPAHRTTGVLLAGGRATRMGGRDKAFAAVGGEPIIARSLRIFASLFGQIVIATNDPDRFGGFGVEIVTDRFVGGGPLAGLHAAMGVAKHPHVFVAACDMPGLDARVIRFLLDRVDGADAVVPEWDGDIEPLHAVYAVRTRPIAEECLREGRAAMRDFLPRLDVHYVSEQELASIAGTPSSFLNVNTPEELAAVGGRFEDGEP